MAIQPGTDLTGTKDGVNDAFTIDVVPITGSEIIIFNTSILKPVASFSSVPTRYTECIINGQNVQVGLPPNANDRLWYICDLA